jgi:hypothetical protein
VTRAKPLGYARKGTNSPVTNNLTPIVRRCLILLAVFCSNFSSSHGQETATEKFEMGVWSVPPGFLNSVSSQDLSRKRLTGFRAKQPPGLSQYDARDFLTALGVEFPPGSEAIFDASAGNLVVRNTRENLELVDILTGGPVVVPFNPTVSISTYECALPAYFSTVTALWPSYFKLTESGAELTLLDRVSAVTKSGIRTAMNHVNSPISATPYRPPGANTSPPSFQKGEWGTIAESEIVVGPDGKTIDANVIYFFRQAGAHNISSDVSLNTSFTTMDGHPVVLSISPSPRKGRFIIVVANVSLASYRDWGLEKAPSSEVSATPEKSEP